MGNFSLGSPNIEEIYKGKVVGFSKLGMATYPDNRAGGCVCPPPCLCCGGHLACCGDAQFCPICSVVLGLVELSKAEVLCTNSTKKNFELLKSDDNYKRTANNIVESFKRGIKFAVQNAICTLKDEVNFDYWD